MAAANIFARAMTKKPTASAQIEIPFDLNKIFSLTYEFQPLKEVLEYLFRELQNNGDKILQVDTKLVSKMMQFEKYSLITNP
jgi:hypothetical protein